VTDRHRSEGAAILDGATTQPKQSPIVVAAKWTPTDDTGPTGQGTASPGERPNDQRGTDTIGTLSVDAVERANSGHLRARVVSIPSWELVEQQDRAYRDQQVPPPDLRARVWVEEGSVLCWDRCGGRDGAKIGMHLRVLVASQGFAHEVRFHAERSARRGKAATRERRGEAIVNPLRSLHDQGQAVWLDFLARRFIAEGALKQLVDRDGLAGVTSNPSILRRRLPKPPITTTCSRSWRGGHVAGGLTTLREAVRQALA
jgi:hypothetical protein